MKKTFFAVIFSVLLFQALPALAESFRGTVSSINENSNSLFVWVKDRPDGLPQQMNVILPDTSALKGVRSIEDIKVGDEVVAEGESTPRGFEVRSLQKARDRNENKKAERTQVDKKNFDRSLRSPRSDETQLSREHDTSGYGWQDKIIRGVANIIGSPIEIARAIHIRSNEENLGYGWTVGLVEGVGKGMIRLGTGVIDIVTFPFGFPKDDKSPLIEPEYPWQAPASDNFLRVGANRDEAIHP